MVIAFISAWIVIGLLVFFVAVRGGPRKAGAALQEESALTRRATTAFVVLMFAFGIAVPVLVLAKNGEDKAAAAPGGVTLTALEQHGRYLFGQSCATCHTLAASRSVGKVGPNLDKLKPPEALVLYAIANGEAQGLGNMPEELYTGTDAKAVAEYVAAVAGR